jgi:probable HAF family extracellular repeat protein
MQDLGALPGASDSRGYAINNSGEVTGSSYIADGSAHAFLYNGTTMQDLGSLGGDFSTGYGINDSGEVTGYSTNADGFNRAFLYDGTTMRDLGTLGGDSSQGISINNSGMVTGNSDTADGSEHVFLYDGTTLQDLGTLGGSYGTGLGVNSSGTVVGYSATADGQQDAFIYTAATGMVDLNSLISPTSGWTLTSAVAINDSGQIVGNGLFDGNPAAILLTPVVITPEPSSLALAALGAIGLLLAARRTSSCLPHGSTL